MKIPPKSISIGILLMIIIIIATPYIYKNIKPDGIRIYNFNKNIEEYINATGQGDYPYNAEFESSIKKPFSDLIHRLVEKQDYRLSEYALFQFAFQKPSLLKIQLESIEEKKINELVKEAYIECSERLGKRKVNVILLPTTEYTFGFTPSADLIVLYVNCLQSEEKLKGEVKWTFAHELAHTYDTDKALMEKRENPLYGDTVLKDMVFEGKANSFANIMYGENGIELNRKYCSNDWKYYKSKLNNTSYKVVDFQSSVIGNDTFYRYDVYVYGTEIVKKYLELNQDKDVKDWLKESAPEFMSEAELLK